MEVSIRVGFNLTKYATQRNTTQHNSHSDGWRAIETQVSSGERSDQAHVHSPSSPPPTPTPIHMSGGKQVGMRVTCVIIGECQSTTTANNQIKKTKQNKIKKKNKTCNLECKWNTTSLWCKV